MSFSLNDLCKVHGYHKLTIAETASIARTTWRNANNVEFFVEQVRTIGAAFISIVDDPVKDPLPALVFCFISYSEVLCFTCDFRSQELRYSFWKTVPVLTVVIPTTHLIDFFSVEASCLPKFIAPFKSRLRLFFRHELDCVVNSCFTFFQISCFLLTGFQILIVIYELAQYFREIWDSGSGVLAELVQVIESITIVLLHVVSECHVLNFGLGGWYCRRYRGGWDFGFCLKRWIFFVDFLILLFLVFNLSRDL